MDTKTDQPDKSSTEKSPTGEREYEFGHWSKDNPQDEVLTPVMEGKSPKLQDRVYNRPKWRIFLLAGVIAAIFAVLGYVVYQWGFRPETTEAEFEDQGSAAMEKDTDGDGLTDAREQELGTNPNKLDSDGDGYDDKTEVDSGYNPNGAGR